jgi:hypothetical protein
VPDFRFAPLPRGWFLLSGASRFGQKTMWHRHPVQTAREYRVTGPISFSHEEAQFIISDRAHTTDVEGARRPSGRIRKGYRAASVSVPTKLARNVVLLEVQGGHRG